MSPNPRSSVTQHTARVKVSRLASENSSGSATHGRARGLPLPYFLSLLLFDGTAALTVFVAGIALLRTGAGGVGNRWYDYAVVAASAIACAPWYIASTRSSDIKRAALLCPLYGLFVTILAAAFWSVDAVVANTAPHPPPPMPFSIVLILTIVLYASPFLVVGGLLFGAAHGMLLASARRSSTGPAVDRVARTISR